MCMKFSELKIVNAFSVNVGSPEGSLAERLFSTSFLQKGGPSGASDKVPDPGCGPWFKYVTCVYCSQTKKGTCQSKRRAHMFLIC